MGWWWEKSQECLNKLKLSINYLLDSCYNTFDILNLQLLGGKSDTDRSNEN